MSLILLCLMFHISQLLTAVKKPTYSVIQPPSSQFRRQFLPPKRSELYNPNYGFEPYWPDGGWVFDRLDITTERSKEGMCGIECPEMYKEFGEICGRDKKYNRKTFKNYCELINEDCTQQDKWMIVYRGACVEKFKFYPITQTDIYTRASDYDYIFHSINPTKYRYVTNATFSTSTTPKL